MVQYLPILILAFVVGSIGTPLARWIALKFGMIDQPTARKVHQAPTPLLGGLAIYSSAVMAVLLLGERGSFNQVLAILAGATLMAALGFLDDRGWLHPQIKLIGGMPIAAIILILSGVHATFLHEPTLNFSVTILWVMGITAAFNLLDNMDGLAAGIAAIAAGFFFLLAILNNQYLVGALAAAILGASLGFLRYNFHPARIFMGDAGALFLGFMMAVLGLKLRFLAQTDEISWMVPVFVLGVPIFDTTLVTISRLRRGLNPMATPGKDHLSHRLVALGLSHPRAVLAIYAAGTILGSLGVLVSQIPSRWIAYAMALVVGGLGLLAIAKLERVNFDAGTRASQRD
jgi:UDP-GlcNAc:undecaprenyl-phosphate GlcNAc-1-phosphate transferase